MTFYTTSVAAIDVTQDPINIKTALDTLSTGKIVKTFSIVFVPRSSQYYVVTIETL